mmetsp:Transcript_130876/g.378643  ORF Transcript_130876/g.378643 Transcript_130876/m.378643 type:complete len:235 (-) Transcript_130876:254-958(-)
MSQPNTKPIKPCKNTLWLQSQLHHLQRPLRRRTQQQQQQHKHSSNHLAGLRLGFCARREPPPTPGGSTSVSMPKFSWGLTSGPPAPSPRSPIRPCAGDGSPLSLLAEPRSISSQMLRSVGSCMLRRRRRPATFWSLPGRPRSHHLKLWERSRSACCTNRSCMACKNMQSTFFTHHLSNCGRPATSSNCSHIRLPIDVSLAPCITCCAIDAAAETVPASTPGPPSDRTDKDKLHM